jgi:OOP family OmpA-OmpF porin
LIFLLILAFAVGVLIDRRNSRWQRYLARLQSEPGIVITTARKDWGHYSVAGLRDPLAADPVSLASEFHIPADKLQIHLEPYQSLDDRFVRERKFDTAKQRIEEQMILFPVNSSALPPAGVLRIEDLEGELNSLQERGRELGRKVHVNLYGRADQTGAESKNVTLSKERAEQVRSALEERGVAPEMITAIGLGNSKPIRHGSAGYQLDVNRSVSMQVEVSRR